MKLIREVNEDIQVNLVEETVTEGEAPTKKYFIEGIYLQGGIPNRNGRIYPNGILENEVARYIKERIEKNRAYGELGHPNGPQINLERVSHLIQSLKRDGNNYIGKALVTEDTPYGALTKGLLKAGAQLGVSSRGLGSLKNRGGIMEVQEDFRLATAADIVADPSAPDAFVAGLMEGVEWIEENGIWRQQTLEEARAEVNKSLRSKDRALYEETAMRVFQKFVGGL